MELILSESSINLFVSKKHFERKFQSFSRPCKASSYCRFTYIFLKNLLILLPIFSIQNYFPNGSKIAHNNEIENRNHRFVRIICTEPHQISTQHTRNNFTPIDICSCLNSSCQTFKDITTPLKAEIKTFIVCK